jgi:adenylate cyclase
MKEIERRFFIKDIPSSERVLSEVQIFQNYLLDDGLRFSLLHNESKLVIRKEEQCETLDLVLENASLLNTLLGNEKNEPLPKGIEARIRSMIGTEGDTVFFFTFKTGKGMVREEIEFPITSGNHHHITNMIQKIPLEKVRKYIEFGPYKIEVDLYRHYPSLRVAEVEFPNEREAVNFVKPLWFGEEITDVSYSNRTLWRNIQLGGTLTEIESRFFDRLTKET